MFTFPVFQNLDGNTRQYPLGHFVAILGVEGGG